DCRDGFRRAAGQAAAKAGKAARVLAFAHDEKRAPGKRREHLEVRPACRRRRIGQHDAERARRGAEKLPQAVSAKELERILAYAAAPLASPARDQSVKEWHRRRRAGATRMPLCKINEFARTMAP